MHLFAGEFEADSKSLPPDSFYLVRLYFYGPFVCLRLAFFGGTPGALRHRIVREMRERIAALRLETRAPQQPAATGSTTTMSCPAPVATLLSNKSYDVDARGSSLLVQYDKWLPSALFYDNLSVALVMSQLQVAATNLILEETPGVIPIDVPFPEPPALMLFRHLHHYRCVFSHSSAGIDPQSAQQVMDAILPLASRLLVSQRLRDGFRFAYNSPGFVNLLLELQMSHTSCGPERASTSTSPTTSLPTPQADAVCALQVAIFAKQSSPAEQQQPLQLQLSASAPQLVIEYWIEPQIGYVLGIGADPEATTGPAGVCASDSDWRGLTYIQLVQELCKSDYNLLVALQTLEWLRLQYSSQSRLSSRFDRIVLFTVLLAVLIV